MSEVYQSAASGLGGGAGGGRGGAQLSRATEPSSPSVGRLPATPAHAYTRSPSRVDAVAVARERRVGSAAVKVKTPGKLGISGAAARVPARAMTREAAGAYDLAEARRKLSKSSQRRLLAGDEVQGEAGALVHEAATAGLASAARVASLRENAPAVKKRDPLSFDSMADSALDRRHSRFEANMVERERRIMNQMIHYNDDKSEAGDAGRKMSRCTPWVGKSPEKKASESPGAHAGVSWAFTCRDPPKRASQSPKRLASAESIARWRRPWPRRRSSTAAPSSVGVTRTRAFARRGADQDGSLGARLGEEADGGHERRANSVGKELRRGSFERGEGAPGGTGD